MVASPALSKLRQSCLDRGKARRWLVRALVSLFRERLTGDKGPGEEWPAQPDALSGRRAWVADRDVVLARAEDRQPNPLEVSDDIASALDASGGDRFLGPRQEALAQVRLCGASGSQLLRQLLGFPVRQLHLALALGILRIGPAEAQVE